MRIPVFIVILILLLSPLVFAVDLELGIVPSEDTFTFGSSYNATYCGGGSLILNATDNYDNLTTLLLNRRPPIALDSELIHLWLKYQIPEQANTRVISSMVFESTQTDTCQIVGNQAFTRQFSFITNKGWYAHNITYNNEPSLTGQEDLKPNNFLNITGSSTSSEFLNDSLVSDSPDSLMNWIYNTGEENISFYSNELLYNALGTATSMCAPTEYACIASEESGSGLELVFTFTDFLTKHQTVQDVSGNVYFDFESGYTSTASTINVDVRFNPSLNIVEFFQPYYLFDNTPDQTNNLDNIPCANFGYATGIASGVDPIANNPYIFCVNLTDEHNGQQYYGKIKLLAYDNFTGGADDDIEMYWSIEGAEFEVIGDPSYDPDPPEANNNLTITWTTSNAYNTNLRYRTKLITQSSYGSFNDFIGNPNYTYVHEVILSDSILQPSTDFQFYLFGDDGANNSYSTTIYEFSTATGTVVENLTGIVPETAQFSEGFHVFTQVVGTGIPLETTVCLTGDTGTSTPLCSVTNRIYNESFTYGYAEVMSYLTGFDFGEYNVTISANGYVTINKTLTYDESPQYFAFNLEPAVCTEVLAVDTENQCLSDTPEVIAQSFPDAFGGQSQFYCEFNPDRCRVYSGSGGCLDYGMWIGYGCALGQLPEGVTANSSVPRIDTGQVNGTGNVINPIRNVIIDLFGFNTTGALAFIGMIFTFMITIIIMVLTRNGLIGTMTFVISMLVFTIVEWFPLYIMLIFGLIAAFVAAKLLRSGTSEVA